MADKFEERKVKIANILDHINNFVLGYQPLGTVDVLYRVVLDSIFEPVHPYSVDYSKFPQYIYDNGLKLFIIRSDDTYTAVEIRSGPRIRYSIGFVTNNVLYYQKKIVCQRSFEIVDEKLVLGDVTETQFENFLEVFYKLPGADKLLQKHILEAKLKKCMVENRDIRLVFDNDVLIDISEILLSTYSPVYNMLYNRDKLEKMWHIPGNPTQSVAQLIKDHMIFGGVHMRSVSLSIDELNSYVEIFRFMGLDYDIHSK